MTHLLVLRPEPGAAATAQRIAALGWRASVAPLFTVGAVAWAPPITPVAAIMLTSANAARLGGAGLAAYLHLPCHVVGGATAAAAAAAGFVDVRPGGGTAAALAAGLAGTVLHLAGREHKEALPPGGLRRVVYAADAVASLPTDAARALDGGAVALLHSARAAASFAALLDRPRDRVAIACLSAEVARAAGEGWRAVAVADTAEDAALLAAAGALCDHAGVGREG